MFKKIIHDWAYDTDGLNARKKEAIEQILPCLEKIEQLWKLNPLNERYLSDIFQLQALIYSLGGTDELINEYNRGLIAIYQKAYQNKGMDYQTSTLLGLKKLINNLNLTIKSRDYLELLDSLKKVNQLLNLSNIARQNIYSANYLLIYTEIVKINAFQKKYMDLKNLIGEPININNILGINGEKIKRKDPLAINYIENLLAFINKFQLELSLIEARNISKQKRNR